MADNCWNAGDLSIDETRLMLALTLTPGVGPSAFHRLMGAFGSAETVYRASGAELVAACPRLKPESRDAIRSGPDLRAVRHQEESCQRQGVRIVSHRSPEYPAPLRTLSQPPPFLFLEGGWLPEDRRALAVVGTRYPSGYGRRMARDLSMGMAESGFTVVSGLARGIDTLAHEAALDAGGRTAAVLGSGLDWIYPGENIHLARRIARQGFLLSEFPMGTAPQAHHFPRRNRLLSALGLGTLVVEAGNDSGALITAGFALEQGREIFAVPGAIYNPGARGPHKLIQEGAHLAENHADILSVLQGLGQAVPARRVLTLPAGYGLEMASFGGPAGAGKVGPPDPRGREAAEAARREPEASPVDDGLGLDGEAQALLSILGGGSVSLDAISDRARDLPLLRNAPAHRLLTGLLELELQGKVRRMPGAFFTRA